MEAVEKHKERGDMESAKSLAEIAAEVKKRHKATTVYVLKVPEDDSENPKHLLGWLRKPNLDELGFFAINSQTNPMHANRTMLRTIWLEGDEKILEDEDCLVSAMTQMGGILKVRQSEMEKF